MKNFNTKQQKNALCFKSIALFMMLGFALSSNAQIVGIPNANFKNALLNHSPVIDINGDGQIQQSEAQSYTGPINVSGKSITTTDGLVGLEYFFNITELDCSNNNIGGTLNLMSNALLTSVRCNSNQLTSLGVNTLFNLDFLHCSTNNLTSLDVSNNTALKTLWASNNQLTTIDVSNNTALENMSVQNNNLTGTLNLDVNNALMYLQCFDNDLTELSATYNSLTLLEAYNNPSLTYLNCDGNDLTSLDLSGLPSLEILYCYGNQLTSLDLSASPALVGLYCWSNQLTSLNVSNNPALEQLSCEINQLTSLDVSNNPALVYLSCYTNQLTSVDVSNNPALELLDYYENQLTSIDVSANPALQFLDCSLNQITSLDVSANPDLTTLYCDSNQLTNLNVANGNNTNLSDMWASSNNLTCIKIDSGFTPPTDGSWKKDPVTDYDPNCAMGVSDLQSSVVSIYPNPVADVLHIQTQGEIKEIRLLSVTGQLLKSLQRQNSIDLSAYNSGIYFLHVTTENGTAVQKLMKK